MQSLSPLIHLIDDDAAVRDGLALQIDARAMVPWSEWPTGNAANQGRDSAVRVQTRAAPEAFMREFDRASIGAIVLDVRMPDISGLTVLETLVREGVDQPIIMLTEHGTVEMCRRAFKSGAAEFLEKPVDDEMPMKALQTRCANTFAPANATTPTANPAIATPCFPNENAKCSASS